MKLAYPELRTRLAAEYVLGTLKGGARRRFEEHLASDHALRDEVAQWEAHLTPLAERLAPIEPPARVWRRIEARISAKRAPQPGFWKRYGLALASFVMAGVVMSVVLNLIREPAAPMMLTAVLDDAGGARMVIEQKKSGLIVARLLRNWQTPPGIDHELWVIPANGQPRSLGVVKDNADTTIALPGLDARLQDGAVFAVSLEPTGGSPSGQPTGKVVCKGVIARMPGQGQI
jgi:anti-sigma-K factor RskA